ncbi:hypothetical protein STRDD12_01559 [Streptococcus sp. DD12]|nr:hypothetical protein STRDD12_01559 [Streptococcus sp. DD12]
MKSSLKDSLKNKPFLTAVRLFFAFYLLLFVLLLGLRLYLALTQRLGFWEGGFKSQLFIMFPLVCLCYYLCERSQSKDKK